MVIKRIPPLEKKYIYYYLVPPRCLSAISQRPPKNSYSNKKKKKNLSHFNICVRKEEDSVEPWEKTYAAA